MKMVTGIELKWQLHTPRRFRGDVFGGWQVNVFVHENYATNGDLTAWETATLILKP